MNIEKILSTKERVSIIRSIIYSENPLGVNEVAAKLGLSKGLVSKYFEILENENILERMDGKLSIKNTKEVKALKIQFNVHDIDTGILKRYKFVKAMGLYGSCSKGTNTESSDIDLWIKTEDASDEEIAKLTSELRRTIKNAKIIVLDAQKIQRLKKDDPLFYYSLYFGSVILHGQEDAL